MAVEGLKKNPLVLTMSDSTKKAPIKLGERRRPLVKTEWAEELDMNSPCPDVENPAIEFPFELDNFQKQAIQALENGFNVFVAAHTSAGKTVVAEYAMAMAIRNSNRAIYTSPLKALSNQKFSDFSNSFNDVGLITGDVQIKESAECLIMTTEILRSMLYNSSDKIRNLEFVVFDEVHYINDPERGHVWEEVLILLPANVQIVMLSATVPNVVEFANWVGRTQQRKVFVCTTLHRPVPLQHHLYVGGGGVKERLYMVKEGDGSFNRDKFHEITVLKKEQDEKQKKAKRRQLDKLAEMEKEKRVELAKKRGYNPANVRYPEHSELISAYRANRERTYWREFVGFLKSRDWMPTVVFAFSRKTCDILADLMSSVDLTTKTDKMHINSFFKKQIERLDEVDRNLPQILKLEGHLINGIGVHHSGILPILKEIVEVLFQKGLVKMLFATETFAMGVNMPARTVMFHSIKKFDGNQLRILLPSEYIQMAGRAGRRGKDTVGNVVISTQPEYLMKLEDLEQMMLGSPCQLKSQFKLTYRMILNTLSSPGKITVQTIMARSYCENMSQLKHSQYKTDLTTIKQKEDNTEQLVKDKMNKDESQILEDYFDIAYAYSKIHKDMKEIMLSGLLSSLHVGRLVKVTSGPYINRIGVVVRCLFPKAHISQRKFEIILLKVDDRVLDNFKPTATSLKDEWLETWYNMLSWLPQYYKGTPVSLVEDEIVMITVKIHNIVDVLNTVIILNSWRIASVRRDIERITITKKVAHSYDTLSLIAVLSRAYYNYNEVLVDNFLKPIPMWIKIKIDEYSKIKAEFEISRTVISSFDKKDFLEKFQAVFNWKYMLLQKETLQYNLSDESMTLYPDYLKKLSLLKERNFISDSDTVLMKGLMASRVGKYELIVSELLMENVLQELGPEEVAALMSVLVCQARSGASEVTNAAPSNDTKEFLQPVPTVAEEKVAVRTEAEVQRNDEDMHITLPASLNNAILKVKEILTDIHLAEKYHSISDNDGSEGHKLSFDLVPIMYCWALQRPFGEVMEMAQDYQEGLLVRYIQQLLEALKEVEAAAKVMGDPAVPEKIAQAGEKIKRGIVFAPSLYTHPL